MYNNSKMKTKTTVIKIVENNKNRKEREDRW